MLCSAEGRSSLFLTGNNYRVVKCSGEASVKAAKKYLSAILIDSTLWGFIGFAFAPGYFHANIPVSIIGAFSMILVVIRKERQIIPDLGNKRLILLKIFFFIELFVAASKWLDSDIDYDSKIIHQNKGQIKLLVQLTNDFVKHIPENN